MSVKQEYIDRDSRALRRHMLVARCVSVAILIFGAGSIVSYFDVSWTGLPADSHQIANYEGQVIWLIVGVLFLFMGSFFVIAATKVPRRLIWILNNVDPREMSLSIELDTLGSPPDSYYALLSNASNGETPEWIVSLYVPSWDTKKLQEQTVPAKVYSDPDTGEPAVIETEDGLLWKMGGDSAKRS